MTDKDDFYIHLPSNSSQELHPENTTATYSTALARRISLPGDGWAAALLELQYPATLYNVIPGENEIRVQMGAYSNDTDISPLQDIFAYRNITPGRYSSKAAFVKVINEAIFACVFKRVERDYFVLNEEGYVTTQQQQPGDKNLNYFDLNEQQYLRSNQVQVVIANDHLAADNKALPKLLQLNETLAHQLGFAERNFDFFREEAYTAERPVTLDLGIPPLAYVYCDLLEETFVGDSLVPLLRSIPITRGNFGETVTYSVENTIYVPIRTKEFSSIEIDLRDHAGRKLPFLYGHSSVLVHIKRRRL